MIGSVTSSSRTGHIVGAGAAILAPAGGLPLSISVRRPPSASSTSSSGSKPGVCMTISFVQETHAQELVSLYLFHARARESHGQANVPDARESHRKSLRYIHPGTGVYAPVSVFCRNTPSATENIDSTLWIAASVLPHTRATERIRQLLHHD